MKKPFVKLVFTFAALMIILLIGSSFYMIHYGLARPKPIQTSRQKGFLHAKEQYPSIAPWLDSLLHHQQIHDTTLVLQNQEQHHAMFIYAPQPTNRTAILLHGYHNNATGMLHIAYMYAKLGYNILLPDHHAHGMSQGKMIQMGWNERHDVLQWTALANTIFADSIGNTQQVLHGISMGAALVMTVSGEDTPPYIKGFIEDCGYTSVWNEFENELKAQFNLPAFPILYVASALNKVIYGWSFGEASPLNQVKKCTKPMLFIHGDNDTYVKTSMVYPLYQAKTNDKQLWIAKGSAHALSYKDHPQQYTNVVKKFVSRYIR